MEKCPYCNSTHIHKSGHYKDGRQRYRCVDCHHMLHEGMEIKEKLNKTCPYCGSTRMRKAGHNKSGSQRYYCNDCKRKSSDNEVQIFFKEINTDIECPYCHSHNLKKGGHLKSGAQRYICIDCNRYFSDKTVLKKDLGLTCPTCGSTDIRTSGIDRGKQRYRCHTCKRRFVIDKTERDYKRYEKTCPRCGHTIAKAAGHTGSNTPYYKCLECGHKYREDAKYKHSTEAEKNEMIRLYLNGMPIIHIAETVGRNERTVRTIIGNYYKQEKLTMKQKQLIYLYGVVMGLNLLSVAPIAKCTLRKCKEILTKFPKTRQKRYVTTEREKRQDWAELDKFIMK